MPRHTLKLAGILVSACLAILAVRLGTVQSAAGTAYPPYSSFRADAQGLKALFDVASLVGRRVERSYLPPEDLAVKDTAVIVLGLPAGKLLAASMPGSNNAAMLAAAGNTVVLGLAGDCHDVVVKDWQLRLQCGDEGQYFAGAGWTALQADQRQHAHVVERKFGAGELILIANSRLLTNGALARRPNPALLATVIERRWTILFDEEHLGVAESSSVGNLLRHYRMHGVMLATAVLFLVFVWKNASSFLPRVEVPQEEIAGRDTTAGLSNLLRRSVRPSQIIGVAIAEWAKPLKTTEPELQLRGVAAAHNDPVEAFNAIASALHQERTSF